MNRPGSILPLLRSRRGIALPVALIGLVAVSLLVTTVMLTGSTEFAIGAAHRTASASLFGADAALEQYVADRAQAGPAGSWLTATAANAPGTVIGADSRRYSVHVSRLAYSDNTASPPPGGTLQANEVFSLISHPEDARGRAVGAFLRIQRTAAPVAVNVSAGATSGGNVSVTGNATISDGRSGTNYCNAENNQSEYAVQVSSGSQITTQGSGELEGAANVAGWTKDRMEEIVLDGMTLQQLADQSEIRFGARWETPNWTTTRINSDPGTLPQFNWGCPAELGASCPTGVSADLSTGRHVTVAIDASGLTNRRVVINGRYGQGMLVVLNGSLEVQGNFIFKGIVLVQEDVFIRGGAGGEESKIEGGIISFGASSTIEDNYTGTATIKYNRCAIEDARRAMNAGALRSAPQQRGGGTYSWYELIR
jgi:hypothetical protein